jgi:tetratricopeptide (TPR) repeat protein
MSLKEIEKLREKVEKDPNSKLFVPLAEEYRKEGMLDEAVDVLLKGIEGQPGYMSARVSLGKIYLEKGMPEEARAEFENVVHSIPDNLYAQKKLAEIYRAIGEKNLAIQSYRAVLKINAMDEEALDILKSLESGQEEPVSAETPFEVSEVANAPAPPEAFHGVEDAEAPVNVEGAEELPPGREELPRHTEDDLAVFKGSPFGVAEAGKEEAWEAGVDEEETLEVLEEQAEEPGDYVSFGEVAAALKDEGGTVELAEEASREAASEEGIFAEEALSLEEDVSGAAAPSIPTATTRQHGPTIEEADRRISEGNYAGALNVYRNILTLHPGDKRTLQRLEELKILLKLLGRDKEALIERLDAFLESVEKRRDEFLRRS